MTMQRTRSQFGLLGQDAVDDLVGRYEWELMETYSQVQRAESRWHDALDLMTELVEGFSSLERDDRFPQSEKWLCRYCGEDAKKQALALVSHHHPDCIWSAIEDYVDTHKRSEDDESV